MTRFEGWRGDFQGFFLGLQLDNSKRYFEAHRTTYLDEVRGPLQALLAELEPEFGPAKISRPNRDTRFSADKSPYKTNVYADCQAGGYVALDAKGLTVAGGRYFVSPDALAKYREAAAAGKSGRVLAELVSELESKGYDIGGEELKRVPAPWPQDHPHARLLRHKRLYYWKHLGLQPWLATAEAKEKIAVAWRDGRELERWFRTNVD
jgi:uncharacterized protein (TIGR02453 family)